MLFDSEAAASEAEDSGRILPLVAFESISTSARHSGFVFRLRVAEAGQSRQLFLRAPSKESMNQWLFCLHRSITSLVYIMQELMPSSAPLDPTFVPAAPTLGSTGSSLLSGAPNSHCSAAPGAAFDWMPQPAAAAAAGPSSPLGSALSSSSLAVTPSFCQLYTAAQVERQQRQRRLLAAGSGSGTVRGIGGSPSVAGGGTGTGSSVGGRVGGVTSFSLSPQGPLAALAAAAAGDDDGDGDSASPPQLCLSALPPALYRKQTVSRDSYRFTESPRDPTPRGDSSSGAVGSLSSDDGGFLTATTIATAAAAAAAPTGSSPAPAAAAPQKRSGLSALGSGSGGGFGGSSAYVPPHLRVPNTPAHAAPAPPRAAGAYVPPHLRRKQQQQQQQQGMPPPAPPFAAPSSPDDDGGDGGGSGSHFSFGDDLMFDMDNEGSGGGSGGCSNGHSSGSFAALAVPSAAPRSALAAALAGTSEAEAEDKGPVGWRHVGQHTDIGHKRSQEDRIVVETALTAHAATLLPQCAATAAAVAAEEGSSGDDALQHRHCFFAVYDGHAGKEAVEYTEQNLLRFFVEHPSFWPDPTAALAAAVARTDAEFLAHATQHNIYSGTTALMVHLRAHTLTIANLGDCQGVLCRGGEALPISTPHKPDAAEERARVEAAGGWVTIERELFASRLRTMDVQDPWVASRAGESGGSLDYVTVGRVNGDLAVSRAIGDMDYKGSGMVDYPWSFPPGHAGTFTADLVISTPELREVTLQPSDEFMVLACDGLWDVLTPTAVVQKAGAFLREAAGDCTVASRKLVQLALRCGSADNISVVVVRLQ